jgi:hypothetical protein
MSKTYARGTLARNHCRTQQPQAAGTPVSDPALPGCYLDPRADRVTGCNWSTSAASARFDFGYLYLAAPVPLR